MVLPHLSSVTPKYRVHAKVFVAVLCLVFAVPVALRVWRIFATIDNPPLVSDLQDCAAAGAPEDCFRLPYVVLQAQPNRFKFKDVGFWESPKQCPKVGFSAIPSFHGVDGQAAVPEATILDNGLMVLLNLTKMNPTFTGISDYPVLEIAFGMELLNGFGSQVDSGIIDPAYPPASFDSPTDLKKAWQFQVAMQTNLIFQSIEIQQLAVHREIVPDHTRMWGFPWDSRTHTRTLWRMEPGVMQNLLKWDLDPRHNDMPKCFVLKFNFVEPRISILRPVSVVTQLYMVVSSLGGLLSLSGCLFYFAFVRKYPRTADEKVTNELTLRGTREKERPLLATEKAYP